MIKNTPSSMLVKKKRKRKSISITSLEDATEEERRLHRNAEILRMMPDNIADALARARCRPIWCSETRWRMELRRRSYSKYGG